MNILIYKGLVISIDMRDNITLVVRRKNRSVGGHSNYLNIPKPFEAGKESTIVVGPLLLADPEGEISKRDLREFFEKEVAPAWYRWKKEVEEDGGDK